MKKAAYRAVVAARYAAWSRLTYKMTHIRRSGYIYPGRFSRAPERLTEWEYTEGNSPSCIIF